jgi:hypothetical protein
MKMKRILSSVLVIAVWMILPMTLWANEVIQYEFSNNTDTKVYYYLGSGGNSYPVVPVVDGLPEGWNSDPNFDETGWSSAFEFLDPPDTYLKPSEFPIFNDKENNLEAQWISYAEDGINPEGNRTDGIREVYLYRKTFKVPAVAYDVSGEVAIASDNYGWLYVNGEEVLKPKDRSENDRNFESPPSTKFILPKLWTCDNVLAAEVQDGCGNCGGSSIIPNGPTGTIFSLTLDYELPDVEWQPPVTNSGIRKNGSTLPLKFRLYIQDGKLIKKVQYVTLAVHEGKLTEQPGPVVKDWTLGNSVQHLRFSKGNGQYIANFQTQKVEDLEDGFYTASVHDGCTEKVLGHIEFNLVGKKKEKDPKPPKPKK